MGFIPQVILSGRRVNDMMAGVIAGKVVKLMATKGMAIKDASALLLGVTFKENCPDIRNTKVVDIYSELKQFGLQVEVCDPWADAHLVKAQFGIDTIPVPQENTRYDVIMVLTFSHKTVTPKSRDFSIK